MKPNTPASCNASSSLIYRSDDQQEDKEVSRRKRSLVQHKNMSDEEKRQALLDVLKEALRIVNAPEDEESPPDKKNPFVLGGKKDNHPFDHDGGTPG